MPSSNNAIKGVGEMLDTFLIQGCRAATGLTYRSHLKSGEVLLVHGAAGGGLVAS